MRRLMSVAAFAAALTMTAPVWAQTAEQLNQQQLSTMTNGAPAVPPGPAYAGAPAPAYPYPYPYPYYPYPYPYPAYAPAYDYYPVGGVWIGGGGCCWGGGWHGGGGWGGGWHGGGGHR